MSRQMLAVVYKRPELGLLVLMIGATCNLFACAITPELVLLVLRIGAASAKPSWPTQPRGSQFTIIRSVPASAKTFGIAVDVPLIDAGDVLDRIGYDDSWIEFG